MTMVQILNPKRDPAAARPAKGKAEGAEAPAEKKPRAAAAASAAKKTPKKKTAAEPAAVAGETEKE
jgi:hypothetical protein